eukprot:577545_1
MSENDGNSAADKKNVSSQNNPDMDIVNNEEFYSLKEKIQYCSIIQVIVSLIFWIWALLNVLRGTNNFDSGCVLFVLSLVSGMFGFASMNLSPSSPQKKKRRALSFAHLNLGMTICSHILICFELFWCCNYDSRHRISNLLCHIWHTMVHCINSFHYMASSMEEKIETTK